MSKKDLQDRQCKYKQETLCELVFTVSGSETIFPPTDDFGIDINTPYTFKCRIGAGKILIQKA